MCVIPAQEFNPIYLGSVAVREEVAIYLLKFFYAEMSARTVLQEAFVPFLNLGIFEREEEEDTFSHYESTSHHSSMSMALRNFTFYIYI